MRARSRICLTASALSALALVPGSVADAKTVDQTYAVPDTGSLVVVGHGYGHGHGMSQYGARGAARQGLGYKQILAFYYPGTTVAAAPRRVRVLITADTTDNVVVSPVAGLTVRDRGAHAAYSLPAIADVTRWRLGVVDGKAVVSYRTDSWHPWRTLEGEGVFSAGATPLTLWTPAGARDYRGTLRAAAPSRGSTARDTVNVVSMDDYVKGVVPAEMPTSWETPALRAQAVAARTYGAWSRASRASSYYQICDTTSCQVYAGVAGESAASNSAVDATAGQILTYAGAPAFTQFSSSSGGWTSAGSAPYLVAQQDPYEAASGNPYTDWKTTLQAAAIERAWPALGRLRSIHVTSREGYGDWQGRVWGMTLHGSKNDVTVSGDTFRSRFGLRSTYFSFGG